jgi:hypothetical protein
VNAWRGNHRAMHPRVSNRAAHGRGSHRGPHREEYIEACMPTAHRALHHRAADPATLTFCLIKPTNVTKSNPRHMKSRFHLTESSNRPKVTLRKAHTTAHRFPLVSRLPINHGLRDTAIARHLQKQPGPSPDRQRREMASASTADDRSPAVSHHNTARPDPECKRRCSG